MGQNENWIKQFGTTEPPARYRQVSIGPLSFLYSAEGLRRIAWHGTELVRAIAWPIRDENWGTYPVEMIQEKVEDRDGFAADLTFSVGAGRLVCDLRLRANAKGDLRAEITMTPNGEPFATNRAGFTVLHPIAGFAGAPLLVAHDDGTIEATSFPKQIQPDQPVKDIAGLNYCSGKQAVDIIFDGEVFEMEDQRNWSDASFKTYCVPLLYPFTYSIDEPTHQSVRMSFSGDPLLVPESGGTNGLVAKRTETAAPDIGLVLESGWVADTDSPLPDVAHALIRVSPFDDLSQLCTAAKRFSGVDLEIVLPDKGPVEESLRDVAAQLSRHGISPNHVIALPEAYLASHQPVGPWPDGPRPNDLFPVLRKIFPDALIGGGMLTNFTEVNRCRPDPEACDYITHGLTPLVHAGDDMSVLETLETLPQIFDSATALAKGRSYRLGLVSIGMRSNPYGAAVAENPQQIRRTMAHIDPRHRGLFAAAYATGVLAATETGPVAALCLGAPVGPFGLLYDKADYPQAGYDGTDRLVYPLYHVVCAACAMMGQPRLALSGLPSGMTGFGAQIDGKNHLILANLSDQSQQVTLGADANVLHLDTTSFEEATRDPDWLDTAPRQSTRRCELSPLSVAFLRDSVTDR